jgi:hypothetical protein
MCQAWGWWGVLKMNKLPIIKTMQRQTIKTDYLMTLDWLDNRLVDWNAAGKAYSLDGTTEQLQNSHFGAAFDASVTSPCGNYVLIYYKLGTKALLLKNGNILREINRSYYHADTYEFPAVFFTWNDKTYLAHCPGQYCRLDFEEVESGKIITNIATRNPEDIFHSRLEVSPDNKSLLSKGWHWHPFDTIQWFDIEACMSDPCLLDRGSSISGVSAELCSASFMNNDHIVVCTSREEPLNIEEVEPILPAQIAVWNFKKNEVIQAVKVDGPIGNVFAIDKHTCWDLFEYPKIIELSTGRIVDKIETILSGQQTSSIIHHLENLPKIAYNRHSKQIAIATGKTIEVLTPTND